MGYPQQLVNTWGLWLVSAVIGQTPTYVGWNPAISGRSGGRAAVSSSDHGALARSKQLLPAQ